MKIAIACLTLLLASCTVYTEKQSEAVSQNVYATQEALDKARVDLAYFYSTETTKFIKPPKRSIKINAVYEAGAVVKNNIKGDKTRVVIVPEQYKNNKVVVVESVEYQKLLQDRDIKKILDQDNKNKELQLQSNKIELTKQIEMKDKLIKDLNFYQTEVYKLRLRCLWLSLIIIGLLLLIGGFTYLKMSKPFFL